jgi:hypothetical protein
LSIHFPTGLCDSKSIKEQESQQHNRKPESLISESSTNDPNLKKKLMKNYGFIGLWMNMQKTFCGVNTSTFVNKNTSNLSPNNNNGNNTNSSSIFPEEEVEDKSDQFNSLNISPSQLKSLSLLFQIMYSNPVILFSPNTTIVTENLIKKSNATFELIDRINLFFRQWLDTSDKLIDYLKHEKTNKSLSMLNSFKSIALNLTNSTEIDYDTNQIIEATKKATTSTTTTTTSKPLFLNENINNKLNFTLFKENNVSLADSLRDVSNRSVDDLIEQIRMIDSAACSWLSLMSGVNLNVFKGI